MTLNAVLLYDDARGAFVPGEITYENGVITAIAYSDTPADPEADLLLPGLIDVHTHGQGGFDFISATDVQLQQMRQFYAQHGVTTVVPTLASDTWENMLAAVARIRDAGFDAVHLEGRYINPQKRGAHASKLIAPLCADDLAALFACAGNMHVHISAAYELDDNGSFLNTILANGATAGLAHTTATYEQATALVARGVRAFSHLFNAMPPIHHRAGGAVTAGLLSDAYTEIICDGFHLAPETVHLVQAAKSADRVVLITDSMEGTGCPDGTFHIAGCEVQLRDGKAYTTDGAIAGSTLQLLDGVRNYAAFCGIPFVAAVRAATVNPAEMLGLRDRGRLAVGCRADFVRLSADHRLKAVYCGGEVI